MAKGDIRSGILTMSADSYGTIRPAVGETWLLTGVTTKGDGTNPGYAYLYEGVGSPTLFLRPDAGLGEGDLTWASIQNIKLFIDNNIYLGVRNDSVSTERITYSAVQWI